MNLSSRNEYNKNLAVKAAWYYYVNNLTQQQIADTLYISRNRVLRLLDQAREEKIVQFNFPTKFRNKMELENRLIERYKLQDVFVVPSTSQEKKNISVANAAAMYLNDRIHEDAYINVGYGETVNHVINELAQITSTPVSFISLTGGVRPYLPATTTTRFNANLYIIPAPLLMSNEDLAQKTLQEQSIKDILNMNKLANYTVISIGGMNKTATTMTSHLVEPNDFLKFKMSGATGDILLHFFDKYGNIISSGIDKRLIGVSIDQLKEFKNVIGVAAGKNKVDAIRSALEGKYLDILITDEITAKGILD